MAAAAAIAGGAVWIALQRSTAADRPSDAARTAMPARVETVLERRARLLPTTSSGWSRMAKPYFAPLIEPRLLQQTRLGSGHPGLFTRRPLGYRPVAIVLHTTGSGQPGTEFDSLEQLGAYFQRTGVAASHYAVDRRGRIVQFVDDRDAAFHTATPGWNGISIGIEMINDSSGDQPFPPAQIDAVRTLVTQLGTTYGIPAEAVVRHRDVQAADRSDPPLNFDWGDFTDSITQERRSGSSGVSRPDPGAARARLAQGRSRIDVT